MLQAGGVAGRQAQAGEGLLAQAQLGGADDTLVVDDIEHGQDGGAIAAHLDLGQRLNPSARTAVQSRCR